MSIEEVFDFMLKEKPVRVSMKFAKEWSEQWNRISTPKEVYESDFYITGIFPKGDCGVSNVFSQRNGVNPKDLRPSPTKQ